MKLTGIAARIVGLGMITLLWAPILYVAWQFVVAFTGVTTYPS